MYIIFCNNLVSVYFPRSLPQPRAAPKPSLCPATEIVSLPSPYLVLVITQLGDFFHAVIEVDVDVEGSSRHHLGVHREPETGLIAQHQHVPGVQGGRYDGSLYADLYGVGR